MPRGEGGQSLRAEHWLFKVVRPSGESGVNEGSDDEGVQVWQLCRNVTLRFFCS